MMARRGGKSNLIPLASRTTEEQRDFHRKGGIASGAARRQKRDVRRCVQMLADLPLPPQGKVAEVAEQLGLPDSEKTFVLGVSLALYMSAMAGNAQAARLIMQTLDEMQDDESDYPDFSALTDEELLKIIEWTEAEKP